MDPVKATREGPQWEAAHFMPDVLREPEGRVELGDLVDGSARRSSSFHVQGRAYGAFSFSGLCMSLFQNLLL